MLQQVQQQVQRQVQWYVQQQMQWQVQWQLKVNQLQCVTQPQQLLLLLQDGKGGKGMHGGKIACGKPQEIHVQLSWDPEHSWKRGTLWQVQLSLLLILPLLLHFLWLLPK